MADVITYSPDLQALKTEVINAYPEFISDEGKFLGIDKTPTVHNGKASLALVRNPSPILYSLNSLQVLGTYEEVFADPALKSLYDSVYSPTFTYLDEEGEQQTATRPEKFGVFA